MRFYSQHGEDQILWQFFKNQKTGTFLDVGALDGVFLSNTYLFEKLGWKGICIEAHPDYIKFLKKSRPNSKIVNAAATSANKKSIKFFANKKGALSTISKKSLAILKKRFNRDSSEWTVKNVPSVTVNTVLERNKIDNIDFVSIDVEGDEIEVLKGFDLKKYKPRLLVIEAMTKNHKIKLKEYMRKKGYMCARTTIVQQNLFFCRSVKDANKLKRIKLIERPRHTRHPLYPKK